MEALSESDANSESIPLPALDAAVLALSLAFRELSVLLLASRDALSTLSLALSLAWDAAVL